MEKIEKKFEKAFNQLGESNPLFPVQAKEQMFSMVEQIAKSNTNFNSVSNTNQSIAVKAGFAMEEIIVETHNLDAILNNDSTRAYNDQYKKWFEYGFKKNDTQDIIAIKDTEVVHQSQVKVYKSSDTTAKAMREIKNGEVKYADMDSLIGPSDQINPQDNLPSIKDEVHKTILKESGPSGRKEVAEAAKMVEEKATDVLNTGKSKSTAITKSEAEEIAKDPSTSSKKTDIENSYQTKSTLQQMGKAAIGAASISAIMSGAYNTVHYINLVKEGKITEEEAVYKILAETVSSSADSTIKASAIAGTQSLLVRYGSATIVEKITEQGLKGMLRSNVATIGVVSGIEAIKDLVRLGQGKITTDQFYERQGKGVLNTTAGVTGGSVGYAVGASIATSFGAVAGSGSLIALGAIGGISGGLIAGLAMQIAIENHIEAAYFDTVRNGENLLESMELLENISQNIFNNQIIFSEFVREERRLDNLFQQRLESLNRQSKKMNQAIDLI